MTFTEAVKSGFNNYSAFAGRASRSAFWYWALFAAILGTIASTIDRMLGFPMLLQTIVNLGLLLPGLAVGVRRLHDIGKPWKYMLIGLIPILGWAYLIYLYVQPSVGANEYGEPA